MLTGEEEIMVLIEIRAAERDCSFTGFPESFQKLWSTIAQ